MTNFYLSWKTSWNDGFLRTNAEPVTGSVSKKGLLKTAMLSLLFLFVLGLSQGFAQTTLISPTGDGGFENGTTLAANNWVAVNSNIDGWIAGTTPVVSAGQRCAFVSSTTTGTQTWTYSQTSRIQHLYYNVTIPQGESGVTLSFKWKATGEGSTNDWDNLKVFWGTAAQIGTPTANTAVSSTYRVGNAWYNLSSASYNSSTISLTGIPGTSYRLVFSWKSDGSDIVNPPAAIDEVSLISRPPVASDPPITFSATEVTSTGMKINWVDNSTNETAFKIYRSTDNVTFTQVGGNIATTTGAGTGQVYSSVQTGLSPTTTYYYRISSIADLESTFLTGSQATTAPTASAPPITFSATEVTSAGMKINWVDNSTNETAFRLYSSTDNVTFTQVGGNIATTTGAATGQAYSSLITGLLPNTTYYFRVSSIFELESSFLTGTQATNAAGNFTSVVTGNFGSAGTWDLNTVPTLYDSITISNGTIVTIDATGQASNNVTINVN